MMEPLKASTLLQETIDVINQRISDEHDNFLEQKAKYEDIYMSKIQVFEARKQEILNEYDFLHRKVRIVDSASANRVNKVLTKYGLPNLPCNYSWDEYRKTMDEMTVRYKQIENEYQVFLQAMKPYKDAFYDTLHVYNTKLGELQGDLQELKGMLEFINEVSME